MIHLPGNLPRHTGDNLAYRLRKKTQLHYVCTGVTLSTGQKVWRICLESELAKTAHRWCTGENP